MRDVFSTPEEMRALTRVLSSYLRLPVAENEIPGAILESVLGHVRQADRLKNYDYVDVVDPRNRIGWSIKSTRQSTPLTWKRAKLPGKDMLIGASETSTEGCQALGNAIIGFCNDHVAQSIAKYHLRQVGFARLILRDDGSALYYEKLIATDSSPRVFEPDDFTWHWSAQKAGKGKEQLSALHGYHKNGDKWWAWHGRGENQLHFSGERHWWPGDADAHSAAFKLPSREQRLSFDDLARLIPLT